MTEEMFNKLKINWMRLSVFSEAERIYILKEIVKHDRERI
jgi:hypothetical protein